MKTPIYIIAFILLGFVSNLQAQNNVSVKVNRAELRGNALNLDMDTRLIYLDVKRYESLQLTFILKDNTSKKMLRLPPIIVNGTNKRQMYERSVELAGKEAAKKGAYAVLKSDKAVIQFVPYRRGVAYKPWMNNCQLVLIGEVKDYNNNTVSRFTNILQKRLVLVRK